MKHNDINMGESRYEYYKRTKDHFRCLFTDSEGYRCSKGASILTTVLACKRSSRDGEDVDPIKGGYCSYHKKIAIDRTHPEGVPPVMVSSELWLDFLSGRFTPDGLRGGVRQELWKEDAIAKWLEDHKDDDIVKRAYLLAKGKGNKEDKRDHIQDIKDMVKGIGRSLPYDPRRREAKSDKVDEMP